MLDCPADLYLREPRQSRLTKLVLDLLTVREKDKMQGKSRKSELVYPKPPAHMTPEVVQGQQT